MKKSNFGKVVYVISIILCVIGIIWSSSFLLQYRDKRAEENQILKEVQEKREEQKSNAEETIENEIGETDETDEIGETGEIEKQILLEYEALYEENNDMYGWIKIEDTEINYPVMFTPENPNFYIDKDWNKEECFKGVGSTIYIDGRTTENTENIIVYGHNRKDLSMFGGLKKYKEKSFYEDHKYIEFDTLYEKQTYEIVSVSKAKVYYHEEPDEYLFYQHMELDSEEEFDEYVSNIKKNAYYDIEIPVQQGDHLITLCTCDKWTEDGRLLVVAKKI